MLRFGVTTYFRCRGLRTGSRRADTCFHNAFKDFFRPFLMSVSKTSISQEGTVMHYSVGALIEKNGKYLLIDRVQPPYGFAGIAGHIDAGEDPVQALVREVKEESGLTVQEYHLCFEEEVPNNVCSKGITVHYWYLYECKVSGEIQKNTKETKSIGWYSKEELKRLKLEPVWQYWFKKLKIL